MSQAKRAPQDSNSAHLAPVMIQVDTPDSSDVSTVLNQMLTALQDAGFVIDTAQPPLRVGSRASRRYVLRGRATQSAIEHATKELGVLVLPDLEVREP